MTRSKTPSNSIASAQLPRILHVTWRNYRPSCRPSTCLATVEPAASTGALSPLLTLLVLQLSPLLMRMMMRRPRPLLLTLLVLLLLPAPQGQQVTCVHCHPSSPPQLSVAATVPVAVPPQVLPWPLTNCCCMQANRYRNRNSVVCCRQVNPSLLLRIMNVRGRRSMLHRLWVAFGVVAAAAECLACRSTAGLVPIA